MLTNNFFENVPDLGHLLLDEFFGGLNRCGHTAQLKLIENKGLE